MRISDWSSDVCSSDLAWTHCGADSSCRSPAACCPGSDAVRAPRRRARLAIAAAKIASLDAMAAAGVPALGELDLRHPDLEMAINTRPTLPSRAGMFGLPAPGAARLLAPHISTRKRIVQGKGT